MRPLGSVLIAVSLSIVVAGATTTGTLVVGGALVTGGVRVP